MIVQIYLEKIKIEYSTWSGDNCWLRRASSLAWSGCKSALDGRRGIFLIDGEGEPFGGLLIGETGFDDDAFAAPGNVTNAFGDGDACTESIPESPACNGSINNELR